MVCIQIICKNTGNYLIKYVQRKSPTHWSWFEWINVTSIVKIQVTFTIHDTCAGTKLLTRFRHVEDETKF